LKDHEHPFFRPLWRRVAVVAVCVAWSIFEFATGAPFWGMIAGGFAAYAVWQFFFLYKPADPDAAAPPDAGTKE
jgi:hypothetical protein